MEASVGMFFCLSRGLRILWEVFYGFQNGEIQGEVQRDAPIEGDCCLEVLTYFVKWCMIQRSQQRLRIKEKGISFRKPFSSKKTVKRRRCFTVLPTPPREVYDG